MTDLYRLVYTSRSRVDREGDAAERTVARILDASRRNNGRAGVTGALLFGADGFAQVLEGPRAAVEATFERIGRDPRHGDIGVLQCGSAAERVFAAWPMAFVGRSARARALWDGLARGAGPDLGRAEGDGFCGALLAVLRAEEGAEPPVPRGLDVERLRSALGAGRPESHGAAEARAAGPSPAPTPSAEPPAPPSAAAPDAAPDAASRVLRDALDGERERTTALRRELDAARIALAEAADEIEGLGRHRDIWADRGVQLRASLADARGALRTAEAERDALRARAAAQDGDLRTLRIHRDIWAERARALATALCHDPAAESGEARPAGEARAVPGRPPLIKAAS